MKSSVRLGLIGVGLMGLMLAGGCGPSANDGGRPAYKLTYSVFFPPMHIQAQTAVAWAEEIEKRSEGRVKITVHSGGSLTKADQCWQGVLNGSGQWGSGDLKSEI